MINFKMCIEPKNIPTKISITSIHETLTEMGLVEESSKWVQTLPTNSWVIVPNEYIDDPIRKMKYIVFIMILDEPFKQCYNTIIDTIKDNNVSIISNITNTGIRFNKGDTLSSKLKYLHQAENSSVEQIQEHIWFAYYNNIINFVIIDKEIKELECKTIERLKKELDL